MLLRILSFAQKALAVLIALICVSLLFVPFYYSFAPGEEVMPREEDYWKAVYLYNDIFLLVFYIPYFTCWGFYLRLKKTKARKVTGTVLVVFSVFQLFYFTLLSMPIQDFDPSYGLLLSFLLAMLTICYFITNRFVTGKVSMPSSVKDVFTY